MNSNIDNNTLRSALSRRADRMTPSRSWQERVLNAAPKPRRRLRLWHLPAAAAAAAAIALLLLPKQPEAAPAPAAGATMAAIVSDFEAQRIEVDESVSVIDEIDALLLAYN